jgi:fatty acid desaturase
MPTEEDAMSQIQDTSVDEWIALHDFRERVRLEGLEERTPALALVMFLVHLGLVAGGIWTALALRGFLLPVTGLVISTYGLLGVANTGHNASHRAVTGSLCVDRALTLFTLTVVLGISEKFWRYKHVQTHHTFPNDVGIDSDIDLRPFFILNTDDMRRAGRWSRTYYSVQHWFLPFALCFALPNMKAGGVRHLWLTLRRETGWSEFPWLAARGASAHESKSDSASVAAHVEV